MKHEESRYNEAFALVALRRVSASKNENTGLIKIVNRSVVREGDSLESCAKQLKATCNEVGTWRLYRSVNKRDLKKAMDQLQIKMILHPEQTMDRVGIVWESVLMKSECKASRNLLIDLDSNDTGIFDGVRAFVIVAGGVILEDVKTPNGYGIVTTTFDSRGLTDKFPECEVKKDALLFMESWNNEVNDDDIL